MSAPIGVMLCGHGSRDEQAIAEFAALAEKLKPHFPDWPLDHGYLEFAQPVIREGLDRLVAGGAKKILAVPGMLFAAGHAKNDIPSVLNTYRESHPGLSIDYGRELGLGPKMIRAAGDRIREAIDAAGKDIPIHDTLLVVVGRGASDPDANSNVAKVARMLWEGFGFGWAETAYSGVTFPLVEPALEKAAKLGFRRIVVFPYFLFTGILVQRIYDAADIVAARHPDIDFVKAPYLNDHPLVLETFVDRVQEILQGQNLMNCALCKYREQILGFEAEVGLPQESHHHHVEGILGGAAVPPPSLAPGEGDHAQHGGGGEFRRSDRHSPPPLPSGVPLPRFAGEEPRARSALHYEPPHSHGHVHHHGGHDHAHSHDHEHGHHPYPHADHPLGPRSLKRK
jgi:sirohydrochlorin cobaltochelatase